MNKKRILIYTVIVVIIVALGGLYYTFRASPTSVEASKADFIITAEDLATAFEENESEANTMYLDKIVQVEGKIIEISEEQEGKLIIYLEGSLSANISCLLDKTSLGKKQLKTGDFYTVKGKCTGYILDVVLTKCAVLD